MEERKTVCDHCRKLIPISQIKFIPKGKDSSVALCLACRTKVPVTEDKTRLTKKDNPKRPLYVCDRCRYKFSLSLDSRETLCPYCGRSDRVRKYSMQSAELLIRSSELD